MFGRAYDDQGISGTGETLINQTTFNTQHMASLAMLDPENFVVVWSGNGPGDSDGVFARQFGNGAGNQENGR